MKRGIIFDMDGTLWDSSPQVAESWNIAMAECGYEREPLTEKDMQSVMGLTMDVIADRLFPDAKGEKRDEILEACCRVENDYLREHGGRLYPKIRETMETLRKNYGLYIVSNCQAGYIEAFLDYYDFWDLIEDRQCYGDNGKQKADNIRILCERNGLDEAIYVGDTQGDYDSSMAAGVGFVHAAYGFGIVDADVPEISAFCELAGLLMKK
ncbi:MAG: HAD family hydrolase [Clostridiales bacterium]|nr:HAD family hydrolase [Clostridiales bacterium]